MPQNWNIEFLSGDPNLWLAFNNLPKTTEKQTLCEEEGPIVLLLGKDSTVCTPIEYASNFDRLQLLSGWKSIDCYTNQGGKNWQSGSNCIEETASCLHWSRNKILRKISLSFRIFSTVSFLWKRKCKESNAFTYAEAVSSSASASERWKSTQSN